MRHQAGLIMIDVLLSVILIGIGLLGIASLQVYALRSSQSAYTRSLAADLANDMAERIRANRSPKVIDTNSTSIDENSQNVPYSPDYGRLKCDTTATPVTCAWPTTYTQPATVKTAYANQAAADMQAWQRLVRVTLPLGTTGGAVVCRSNSTDTSTDSTTTTPLNNPDDGTFTAKTGCLAPTDTNYKTAPYVIKIWWPDIRAQRGAGSVTTLTPTLLLYSTTL